MERLTETDVLNIGNISALDWIDNSSSSDEDTQINIDLLLPKNVTEKLNRDENRYMEPVRELRDGVNVEDVVAIKGDVIGNKISNDKRLSIDINLTSLYSEMGNNNNNNIISEKSDSLKMNSKSLESYDSKNNSEMYFSIKNSFESSSPEFQSFDYLRNYDENSTYNVECETGDQLKQKYAKRSKGDNDFTEIKNDVKENAQELINLIQQIIPSVGVVSKSFEQSNETKSSIHEDIEMVTRLLEQFLPNMSYIGKKQKDRDEHFKDLHSDESIQLYETVNENKNTMGDEFVSGSANGDNYYPEGIAPIARILELSESDETFDDCDKLKTSILTENILEAPFEFSDAKGDGGEREMPDKDNENNYSCCGFVYKNELCECNLVQSTSQEDCVDFVKYECCGFVNKENMNDKINLKELICDHTCTEFCQDNICPMNKYVDESINEIIKDIQIDDTYVDISKLTIPEKNANNKIYKCCGFYYDQKIDPIIKKLSKEMSLSSKIIDVINKQNINKNKEDKNCKSNDVCMYRRIGLSTTNIPTGCPAVGFLTKPRLLSKNVELYGVEDNDNHSTVETIACRLHNNELACVCERDGRQRRQIFNSAAQTKNLLSIVSDVDNAGSVRPANGSAEIFVNETSEPILGNKHRESDDVFAKNCNNESEILRNIMIIDKTSECVLKKVQNQILESVSILNENKDNSEVLKETELNICFLLARILRVMTNTASVYTNPQQRDKIDHIEEINNNLKRMVEILQQLVNHKMAEIDETETEGKKQRNEFTNENKIVAAIPEEIKFDEIIKKISQQCDFLGLSKNNGGFLKPRCENSHGVKQSRINDTQESIAGLLNNDLVLFNTRDDNCAVDNRGYGGVDLNETAMKKTDVSCDNVSCAETSDNICNDSCRSATGACCKPECFGVKSDSVVYYSLNDKSDISLTLKHCTNLISDIGNVISDFERESNEHNSDLINKNLFENDEKRGISRESNQRVQYLENFKDRSVNIIDSNTYNTISKKHESCCISLHRNNVDNDLVYDIETDKETIKLHSESRAKHEAHNKTNSIIEETKNSERVNNLVNTTLNIPAISCVFDNTRDSDKLECYNNGDGGGGPGKASAGAESIRACAEDARRCRCFHASRGSTTGVVICPGDSKQDAAEAHCTDSSGNCAHTSLICCGVDKTSENIQIHVEDTKKRAGLCVSCTGCPKSSDFNKSSPSLSNNICDFNKSTKSLCVCANASDLCLISSELSNLYTLNCDCVNSRTSFISSDNFCTDDRYLSPNFHESRENCEQKTNVELCATSLKKCSLACEDGLTKNEESEQTSVRKRQSSRLSSNNGDSSAVDLSDCGGKAGGTEEDPRLEGNIQKHLSVNNKTCNNNNNNNVIDNEKTVFQAIELCSQKIEKEIETNSAVRETEEFELLSSKKINKRICEGNSRLKRLECKLKEAAGVVENNSKTSNNKPTPNHEQKQENIDIQTKQYIGETENEIISKQVVNISEKKEIKKICLKKDDKESNSVKEANSERICNNKRYFIDKKVCEESSEVNNDKNESDGNKHNTVKNTDTGDSQNVSEKCADSIPVPLISETQFTENGIPYLTGSCEFDVQDLSTFGIQYSDSDFFLVYDELDEDFEYAVSEPAQDSKDTTDSCVLSALGTSVRYEPTCIASKETNCIISNTINSSSSAMPSDSCEGGGTGGGGRSHNPDHENLKSLLKKPGKSKERVKSSNRVVFNEKKNEFFDADYIILIREDCEFDDEDDESVCTCNQHEMVRLSQRLTCCEPNCGCGGAGYEGYEQTPPSPKFAPPIEFVDSVTLSPPEGYKDLDFGEQQLVLQELARQRGLTIGPVCRDCSNVGRTRCQNDSDSDSKSDNEEGDMEGGGGVSGETAMTSHPSPTTEVIKTDQSQQTTPTTPTVPDVQHQQQRYSIEMSDRRLIGSSEGALDNIPPLHKPPPPGSTGSPISGILKGGRLWKQQQADKNEADNNDDNNSVREEETRKQQQKQQIIETTFSAENDESTTRRSVRFIESNEIDQTMNENNETQIDQTTESDDSLLDNQKDHLEPNTDNCNNSISPESTEMMLTFKLGNHILISNNSLRPNSAVRQLFPCTNSLIESEDTGQQYLITSESLKAFEDAKKSKLNQNDLIEDSSIRKTIERNTLRRSLIRYEPRSKKTPPKNDNSLVERIKQLTCDVDEDILPKNEINVQQVQIDQSQNEDMNVRSTPPGEEARKSPEMNKLIDKNNFSPSSSSTNSSNSSMASTYKKITDLFGKKHEKGPNATAQAETQTVPTDNKPQATAPPDLGNGARIQTDFVEPQNAVSKYNLTHEARKQFLSTLAPLTACVGGGAGLLAAQGEDYYYELANRSVSMPGERASVASTIGTEYSLEDIESVLKDDDNAKRTVAPDVLAGTPSASESGDELAVFVQQDAGRIERIKKRYQPETNPADDDDEHDDYGFNRRPSVRGIKPRFGSTNEILQQIQSQLQPLSAAQQRLPNQWPYYSEQDKANRTSQIPSETGSEYSLPLPKVSNPDPKHAIYSTIPDKSARVPPPPNPKKDETNNEYNLTMPKMPVSGVCDPKYSTYSNVSNVQHYHYIADRNYRNPYIRTDENMYQNCTNQVCTQHYNIAPRNCTEMYQTLPVKRVGRPESPPPKEVARNYHQTMVLIPYNHIESYQGTVAGHITQGTQFSPAELVNTRARLKPQSLGIRNPHPNQVNYSCSTGTLIKMGPKPMIRVPFNAGQPVHLQLMTSRTESPQLGAQIATQMPVSSQVPQIASQLQQFATARSTQTPISSNNYYPTQNTRYRPAFGPVSTLQQNASMWAQNHDMYANKISRNSSNYSSSSGSDVPESIYSLPRDSEPSSPTKNKFTAERGVPEGAASVSPQDFVPQTQPPANILSPTVQNPSPANQKPMYYAMNV